MPRGVRGSGKPAASRRAHDDDAEGFTPPTPASDSVPRCRIAGCGAMLTPGGQCPACAFRAKKYAKLFEVQNPNCECGAPRVPKTPRASRMPKRCPCCSKLHARAKAKGITL